VLGGGRFGLFESIMTLLVPWVDACSTKVLIGGLNVSNEGGYALIGGEVG